MKTEQLTFTRFIAALSVIFFHHYRATEFFQNAKVFVSYFFILSGFVLAISQKQDFSTKKDYVRFYINRLARIYPIYLLSNLLYVAIINFIGWGLLLNLSGLQAYLPKSALSYNYPGWSISVELFFYASFPFLVRHFYNRYSLKTILLGSLGFWVFSQILSSALFYHQTFTHSLEGMSLLLYNPVNHINEFILGSAAGLVFIKKKYQWQANYDWAIIFLSLAIWGYLSYLKSDLNLFDHNGLLMVLFIPFLFLLSLNTGYITQLFRMRPLVVAGEISFCLYIFAEPVFIGLIRLSKILALPMLSNFYFSLSVLIGVSYLLHYILEKPLQKIIKQRTHVLLDGKPIETKVDLPTSMPQKKKILIPHE